MCKPWILGTLCQSWPCLVENEVDAFNGRVHHCSVAHVTLYLRKPIMRPSRCEIPLPIGGGEVENADLCYAGHQQGINDVGPHGPCPPRHEGSASFNPGGWVLVHRRGTVARPPVVSLALWDGVSGAQEAEAVAKEAIILTHMLGRYLDDFGNVVRYLDRDGYQVTIYTSPPVATSNFSTDSPENFAEYRKKLSPSIRVESLPYVRGGKMMPWEVLRMMVVGFRLARRHPTAIFQMWSVYVIIACGLPLRLFNRKSLYMVTGLGPVLGSTGRRFWLFRNVIIAVYRYLMSGRNSRCLNHNAADKRFLARVLHASPGKFFVTPGCGVDPKLFRFFAGGADNPHPIVVVPARLIEDKGIREAVAASGILRDRGVEHEMWFTGATEPYPWISITEDERVRAQRDNPSVRFIGFQESMIPVYERADIVCLPTRYPEGTPTALIEAAATGRVGVTCETVGATEIVLNELTGLVVPQKDPRSLADALQRLMVDPDLYDRFRQAAYRHFLEHYTKDAALRDTLAAFESLGFSFQHEKRAADFRVAEKAS